MEIDIKKLLIIVLAIIILIIVVVININHKENIESIQMQESEIIYEKDEQSGEYIIYDKNSGDEITRVNDESAIEVYKDNPNYNTKMKSTDPDFIEPYENEGEYIPDVMSVPDIQQ